MSYQVLARKYRPQKFSEVIGQEHVTRTLKNAIEQGRIAHGYIFSGHRGIGKTTIARILAMALNCRSSDKPVAEPCGICESCTEIRAGNSVDVIEIDAATNRGIDEIRELREAARYRPARDRFKIYILDEAHQITDAAFNALLKTLEEPPSHVVFMLATTQPEDIPQTIRSRCQHFSFRAVKFEQIVGQLRDLCGREKIAADEDALALLAEAGDGSMRDALSILDQAIASCENQGSLTRGIGPATDRRGAVRRCWKRSCRRFAKRQRGNSAGHDRLIGEGQNPAHFARQMVRFLRNAVVAKVAGADSSLLQISSDERARVARIAEIVQRRRFGAASANHAAHAWRTRIPPGAALPPGAGTAEDGARAAVVADRAVAERAQLRSRPLAPERKLTLGAGSQKAGAAAAPRPIHFSLRRRLGAQEARHGRRLSESSAIAFASGDWLRCSTATSSWDRPRLRWFPRRKTSRNPSQARVQDRVQDEPGRPIWMMLRPAVLNALASPGRTCWSRCSKPENGRSRATN